MQRFLEYILVFFVLLILQEFVFGRLDLWGVVNPYIYIMIIVMLPMEFRGWTLLMVGFLVGMIMDFTTGNVGLHTICATWLAFVRPAVLGVTAGRQAMQDGGVPLSTNIGVLQFFSYLTVMCLMFCVPFFVLESLSVEYWMITILRIVCSAIFMIITGYFCQLPFSGGGKRV